jgi:phosphopantothenoylcysteine synthetase/decarboxylase
MSISRNIVLGVTGSIAAHKAVDLASLLTKQKCNVHVVMTADAQRFITALPFKVLADEANLLLIAPATANIIAKMAHGIADNALSCIALALSPKAKILIAPAMNDKMWLHPATQQNVKTLKTRGAEFIGPDKGTLSCGYTGIGRMWPVEAIAQRALKLLR